MDHVKHKHKHKNRLVFYRRRIRFPQKTVAKLLGHRDATLLCTYERGRILPPLVAALALGIILRVPVEFLFPDLYDELQIRIRQQEELLPSARQSQPRSLTPTNDDEHS
jgi:DNA-binding XRE family transcriptional regulator